LQLQHAQPIGENVTLNQNTATPGRPIDARLRLGIDLGGTKTEVAVLGPDGRFLLRERAPTPRSDYPATVATIARLVTAAERTVRATCTVGVGIPGAISPATGVVKNANSVWLNGRPLLQDLEAALGRPVRIQNDANCLAMSEATDGAAESAHVVLALILGTGVGAGICIGGSLLVGHNAIAGEWGHNPLPPPVQAQGDAPVHVCWCGRSNCIETWLSGPALAKDFAGENGDARAGPIDAQAVFSRADARNAGAEAAVDRWLDRLARSVA